MVCGDFNTNLALDTHLSDLLAEHRLLLDSRSYLGQELMHLVGYETETIWFPSLLFLVFFQMFDISRRSIFWSFFGPHESTLFGADSAKVSHTNQRPIGFSWGCGRKTLEISRSNKSIRSPPNCWWTIKIKMRFYGDNQDDWWHPLSLLYVQIVIVCNHVIINITFCVASSDHNEGYLHLAIMIVATTTFAVLQLRFCNGSNNHIAESLHCY